VREVAECDFVGPGYGEFKTDYESIFARMTRSGRAARSLVVDHGNPAAMHGAKASSCAGTTNDEEVVKLLLDGMGSHDFAFGRLSVVAEVSGCTFPLSVVLKRENGADKEHRDNTKALTR
jgi:RNA exonuclease 1